MNYMILFEQPQPHISILLDSWTTIFMEIDQILASANLLKIKFARLPQNPIWENSSWQWNFFCMIGKLDSVDKSSRVLTWDIFVLRDVEENDECILCGHSGNLVLDFENVFSLLQLW